MDKEVAAKVMKALLEAGSTLAETIEDVRVAVPEEEFKRHTRVIGELSDERRSPECTSARSRRA